MVNPQTQTIISPTLRKPGTGKLSELARHVSLPTGIVATNWLKVRDLLNSFGDEFDEWQDGLGRAALALRADGTYAASVGGVVLSIPRQVAKSFFVSRIVLAICILYPNTKVIWTAHRTRTSAQIFRNMRVLVNSNPAVKKHILGEPRSTNGEQEILFRNGSIWMFGSREAGFGLGFDAVDIAVFDEAQRLTEKSVEDIVPTTNQSRSPHGALIFYMGTPPRPTDSGELFRGKRIDALENKDPDTLYIEFSADPDCDPDDHEQWRVANPSYPHRTPLNSMLRMRKQLQNTDSWMREALGIWDIVLDKTIIDVDLWNRRAEAGGLLDEDSVATSDLVLGVDVAPMRDKATVCVAGLRADGMLHVGIAQDQAGINWLVPYLIDRAMKNDLKAVVIDRMSPAASLIDELESAGVKVTVTETKDIAVAYAKFVDSVVNRRLRHRGQGQLIYSLTQAQPRNIGDGMTALSRKSSGSDITAAVAATLAVWGVLAPSKSLTRPRRRVSSSGHGRRVIVGAVGA